MLIQNRQTGQCYNVLPYANVIYNALPYANVIDDRYHANDGDVSALSMI
jgi:hypothetical protein